MKNSPEHTPADETPEERKRLKHLEVSRAWKARNKDKIRAQPSRQKDKILEYSRKNLVKALADPIERAKRKRWMQEWTEKNRAHVNKKNKLFWENNKEKHRARGAKYYERNREHLCACTKKWREENPGRYRALMAQARKERRRATPQWVDRQSIQEIYALAIILEKETGIPHEVDHIVPIKGKTVSGLHVSYNLRVVTATINRKKSNSFDETNAIAPTLSNGLLSK